MAEAPEHYMARAADAARAVAATPDGKILLEYLVARFGYTGQSTFDRDALTMALREGQRSVVVHIGQLLNYQPPETEDE